MASLNRVLLMGNLGQDPELRFTPNGIPVCNISVATNEVRIDKDGNRQEQVEWHRVVVYNKQAESVAKYMTKGRSVFVEGKITNRSWDDKATGQKRYSTEIIADRIQFMSQGQGQGQGRSDQAGANPGYAPSNRPAMTQDYDSHSSPSYDAGPSSSYNPPPAGFGNANTSGSGFTGAPSTPPKKDPFDNSFGGPNTPNLDDIPF